MSAQLLPALDWLARIEQKLEQDTARAQSSDELLALERDWERWVRALFPRHVKYPFVDRHRDLWDWVWRIEPGAAPPPMVAIWSRGGGKSATAELATAALGARHKRRYGLYVCGTQEQADKHVSSVASLLLSAGMEEHYPAMARRDVNKYGSSQGWRRNQLRTASGFTLDGIGLDVTVRGFKVDDARPDLIIMDDVDGRHDSPTVTKHKIEALSESVLPAGSDDVAVLFIQNRVNSAGIASQFIDGDPQFLIDHLLSGPHPAVEGLQYEARAQPDGRRRFVITAGTATWPGQDLATCEQQINAWGPGAFRAEAQHEKREQPGGMFSHLEFAHVAHADLPEMVRSTVWCDPAVSNTDESDCYAIEADSIDYNDIIYRRYSWEGKGSPEEVVKRAILKAIEIDSPTVGIETDQGGDTWQSVYWRAVEALEREHGALPYVPRFRAAKAGSFGAKSHRASQMLIDYERAEIRHVEGTHGVLERALFRFPKQKPYDLVDAAFWSWADLRGMVPDDDDDGPGLLLTGSASGWFGPATN